MTQPVQEPTNNREASHQAFRSRQLLRRPTFGPSVEYASIEWSQIVSTGTGTGGITLDIVYFQTTNIDVFSTTDVEAWTEADITNTYLDRFLAIRKNGVYFVNAYMQTKAPSATNTWAASTVPWFVFPLGTNQTLQAEIVDRPPGADFSAYSFGVDYKVARVGYNKHFQVDVDYGPYTGQAKFANDSGSNAGVSGYAEIVGFVSDDWKRVTTIF